MGVCSVENMTESQIIAILFQDLHVFGGFFMIALVVSRINFPFILSMRPEYAINEVTIVETMVLDERITIHASHIVARHGIVLPADVTVNDAVLELFYRPGATMSELFHGGSAVSERINAIFDLAERGINSETFHRVMTIVVDLHVDPNMAMVLDGMMV